ncbi:hypothetical protein JCM16418_1958 [Paenibacillus pini JCM 16418]|uniref:Uncharacterized protein n=1 Tax=Paenibacillus pini JCM 16418 TaxID=1236976 RepID=W7YA55_9BACL|nr:hypothetical protein JCM16418_1958 [Paenibacillus pini JCM 16418]
MIVSLVFLCATSTALTGCGSGDTKTTDAPKVVDKENGKDPAKGTEGEAFVLGSEPLEFTLYGNYDWYTMPKGGTKEVKPFKIQRKLPLMLSIQVVVKSKK